MSEESWTHLHQEGPPPEIDNRFIDLITIPARCLDCGSECNGVYVNRNGYYLGCDRCVIYIPIHDFIVDEGKKGETV